MLLELSLLLAAIGERRAARRAGRTAPDSRPNDVNAATEEP